MTGENASFSMLINGKAILIYREESQQLVRVMGNVGQERPLYAGATGKILGAYQEESVIRKRLMEEPMKAFTENTILSPEGLLNEYAKIREQGYAISDGELNSETTGTAHRFMMNLEMSGRRFRSARLKCGWSSQDGTLYLPDPGNCEGNVGADDAGRKHF